MYHPSYGVLTYLASIFGINDIGWVQKPGIALYSISLVEIWQWSPFIALITLAGLQTCRSAYRSRSCRRSYNSTNILEC